MSLLGRTKIADASAADQVMMLGFSLLQMWFLNTFREFQNALHDKDQQK